MGKVTLTATWAGNIDFKKFFSFINKTGYNDTFTIEATAFNKNGEADTDMLNSCFENDFHIQTNVMVNFL